MSNPPWRNNNAFTSVAPKTSLSKSNQQQNQTANSAGTSSTTQWPDSLRRFVERCLTEVEPKDYEEMQKQLKEEITKAFENQATWTTDWDKKSLPILELRKSQKRKLNRKFNSFQLDENEAKREKRQKRFEANFNSTPNVTSSPPVSKPPSSTEPIIGRSTKLEKQYFRLTSEPDPEYVRPEHILKQTLELLKTKWKEDQNYAYICDQFKSLRQDLTVQHIQNEFTVSVYEIHARIALEKGDLGEYNQCQSQLKQLYALGIKGNSKEFLAYRILYLLHTQNRTEISHLMDTMSEEDLSYPSVKHALSVNEAMTCGDYHRLFRLYSVAPNMGGYVMDCFITRERLYALSAICRAFRPTISIEFVSKELGFSDSEDCIDFIQGYEVGPVDMDGVSKLQTKECFVKFELARQNAFKKVDIKGQI